MIAFGPVPSRRLGRSLGVNNVPPKTCTYACVYCQLGRTTAMRRWRRTFYGVEAIVQEVSGKVAQARAQDQAIDYLTFVADGEPTLDLDLGAEIEALRRLGLPIAVITNASLLWRADVREALSRADWVSLKVDTTDDATWRRTDRPHGHLDLTRISQGMLAFAQSFRGELTTETMLVRDLNDGAESLQGVARALAQLSPARAYLSVPTRPPAEAWVRPPDEATLTRAYAIVADAVAQVELLTGYEGDAFASTGDIVGDLLSITAVHPMRRDAVEALLGDAGAEWSAVEGMLSQGQLIETAYRGATFFMRKLS